MKRYYTIQQAGKTAEVYIFGDITTSKWEESDVTAYSLVQELKKLEAEQISVHIDSYGGSVSEGWAIYNTLKNHPAKVITYGDGFVASAALYPFLAGDERYASNLSAYYFHPVSNIAIGYAEDLRKAADEADAMTEIGIRAFTERTGMDAEEVKKLMEAETWLGPDQALEIGLATAIIQDDTPKAGQSAKRQAMERVLGTPGTYSVKLDIDGQALAKSNLQSVKKPEDPPGEPGGPTEPQEQHKESAGGSLMELLAGIF